MRQQTHLSGDRLMQSTFEADAAARQEMRQVEVEVHAQQQKTNWVWIGYIDSLQTANITLHKTATIVTNYEMLVMYATITIR